MGRKRLAETWEQSLEPGDDMQILARDVKMIFATPEALQQANDRTITVPALPPKPVDTVVVEKPKPVPNGRPANGNGAVNGNTVVRPANGAPATTTTTTTTTEKKNGWLVPAVVTALALGGVGAGAGITSALTKDKTPVVVQPAQPAQPAQPRPGDTIITQPSQPNQPIPSPQNPQRDWKAKAYISRPQPKAN